MQKNEFKLESEHLHASLPNASLSIFSKKIIDQVKKLRKQPTNLIW
jgi:hypothetical protein